MFSKRCLTILALIAAASAFPAQEEAPKPITTITDDEFVPVMPAPWYNVPFFGDITKLFAPLWKLFPSFEEIGPRINVDDKKFEVIMQVKGYKKEDLKVKTKGDFIFVQGTHEAKQQEHDVFASQFFHTYTLPANASAADVTAKLTSDGYLIVDAPINGPVEKEQETDREVPIVETGTPYKKEAIPELTTSEPEITPEEDRKEPTTPSEREDVTEKDNVIPHGNDVTR